MVVLEDAINWRRLEKIMEEHLTAKLGETDGGRYYIVECADPERLAQDVATFATTRLCRSTGSVQALVKQYPSLEPFTDLLMSRVTKPSSATARGKSASARTEAV